MISKNLHRRHLTASQRAVIGVDMKPMLREEAQQRQIAGGARGGHNAGEPKLLVNLPEASEPHRSNNLTGNIRDISGRVVAVSGSTVDGRSVRWFGRGVPVVDAVGATTLR